MVITGNTKLSKYHLKKRQKCILRTLDNLPMKYGYSDSIRLASSCRSVRTEQMDEESLARRISENQRSESRRCFEDVLYKSKQLTQPSVTPRSVWSGGSATRSTHTGPTRFGSPLYRRKSCESVSSYTSYLTAPPKYFKANSTIEETLERSNSAYTVQPKEHVTCIKEHQQPLQDVIVSSFPSFMLVPNQANPRDQQIVQNEQDSLHNIVRVRHSRRAKKISSLFPEPATVVSEDVMMPKITVKQYIQENNPTKITIQMDMGKLTVNSTNRPGSETSNPTNRSLRSSKNENMEETGKVEKIDGHCYTSKHSQKSTESPNEKQTKLTTTNSNTKSNKKTTSKKNSKKDTSESSINDSISENKLPTFICPSSEEKSKEARIRHWIRETTFTNANRHVPLV